MLSQNKEFSENNLKRLINLLLLNGSFIKNNGLINGKMGLSIFFFHLAHNTKNQVYENFAGQLVEQVLKSIHEGSNTDFSSGLSGIGWGIENLLQNGFVDSDGDNILEEIDNAIFRLDRKIPSLIRHYDDFYGYGLYYLYRSKNEVWSSEVLQIIWRDLATLIINNPPANVKISPDYIISLLYFICEIRKRAFCPPDVDKIIYAIPEFISKYVDGSLNKNASRYLNFFINDLGIDDVCCHSFSGQTSLEEDAESHIKSAIYELVFPGILSSDKSGINDCLSFESQGFIDILEKTYSKVSNGDNIVLPGFTFHVLSLLKRENVTSLKQATPRMSNASVYIIERTSRASEYGVRTYLRELITGLNNEDFNITVIHLEANKLEFSIEDNNGIQNWYIPAQKARVSDIGYLEYHKSLVTFLQIYIKNTGKLIFHFNSMRDYQLAVCLREVFVCKMIVVVHYLDWSSALQGDLSRMRRLLSQSGEKLVDPGEIWALKSFENDRKLLNYVDHIVCLADYAFDILRLDYGIEADKITVVYNGLSDTYQPLTPIERSSLREKYMISPGEKIILYAGRLDEIKGVSCLIKAFKEVLECESNCRLWIVGDGAFDPLLKDAEGVWNKICFTGRISQESLFELYAIAAIGVVPSLFEPFGYVAVEMMMHGLPIVVTATTGLDEIVEDSVSGLKVQVAVTDNKNLVDTAMMVQKIVFLLQNPGESERLSLNGRDRYLTKFNAPMMCKKMTNCYFKLLQTHT